MWQALDLAAYWRDHPPVHEMVAAYLGVKPRPVPVASPALDDDPSGFGALIMRFPNGLVPANH